VSLWSVTLFRDTQTAAVDAGNVLPAENFMVEHKKIFDGQCFCYLCAGLGGMREANLRPK
jgi:hypothetical protein